MKRVSINIARNKYPWREYRILLALLKTRLNGVAPCTHFCIDSIFGRTEKNNIVMYMLLIWCGEADKYVLRNFSL